MKQAHFSLNENKFAQKKVREGHTFLKSQVFINRYIDRANGLIVKYPF